MERRRRHWIRYQSISLIDGHISIRQDTSPVEVGYLRRLEFPDPFMHDHPPIRELEDIDPGPFSLGERFADWVYNSMGSWRFILV